MYFIEWYCCCGVYVTYTAHTVYVAYFTLYIYCTVYYIVHIHIMAAGGGLLDLFCTGIACVLYMCFILHPVHFLFHSVHLCVLL